MIGNRCKIKKNVGSESKEKKWRVEWASFQRETVMNLILAVGAEWRITNRQPNVQPTVVPKCVIQRTVVLVNSLLLMVSLGKHVFGKCVL